MNDFKWIFSPKTGGRSDGPNDAMGGYFKKNKYEAFIRESIQNSLDAKDPSQRKSPVRINISLGNINASEFESFFEIGKHIYACYETWKEKGKKFKKMYDYISKKKVLEYICFSDYNTTGMDYREDDVESGFYAFTKSGGNSVKVSKSSGGSYGYGKTALIDISQIRTVLVSTRTKSGENYFAGISALAFHSMNGNKYESQGYYTNKNIEEPVSKEEDIPSRFRRNEAGTSFYIIGTEVQGKDSKTINKDICRAIIKHFWYAIYKKELIVEININNSFDGITIDSENLEMYAKHYFPNEDDNEQRGHNNPRPYINVVKKASSGDDLFFRFKEKTKTLGQVELYLWKTKEGRDSVLNMRSQHMLINCERRNTNYGYYAVFICEDLKGSCILKLGEPPSHDQWDCTNNDEEDNRERIKTALNERNNFISECINQVFSNNKDDGLEIGDLEEYLSVPSIYKDNDLIKVLDDIESNINDVKSYSSKIDESSQQEEKKDDLGEFLIRQNDVSSSPARKGDKQPTSHKDAHHSNESQDKNEEDDIKDSPKEEPKEKEKKTPPPNSGLETKIENPKETPGTGFVKLIVTYRVFVRSREEGELDHVIVINSNRASSCATIKIVTVGEEWDEDIPIIFSDHGTFEKNQLLNVKLKEGKNSICIRFDDKLRHCINIKVYE